MENLARPNKVIQRVKLNLSVQMIRGMAEWEPETFELRERRNKRWGDYISNNVIKKDKRDSH